MMRSGSVLAISLVGCLAMAWAGGATGQPENFRAHLSGAEEVPAVATRAQGQAIFQVAPGESFIHFRLNVANIENVTMAHIHLAPFGQNGPVVVWLYPAAPPPQLLEGRFQGTLAAGAITAASLVGPLVGQTIADLLDEMAAGNAYVNVHTLQFPGGEVRGQIFGAGPGG
jgi:hypothetical protein